MKKLRKIWRKGIRDERGVALLFTLGILSLLMIMALAFAASAINESKSAVSSNDRAIESMFSDGIESLTPIITLCPPIVFNSSIRGLYFSIFRFPILL